MNSVGLKNALLAIGSVIGWFAILLQLVLIIQNRVAPVTETVVRFFSFFTILTNIIVATCCTALWLRRHKDRPSAFFNPNRLTAITVYILVVGIVYNLILRFLWTPTGLQRIVDEILHLVIPLLFFIYWLLFVDKSRLVWKDAFAWLIYPFLYLVFILIRGRLAAASFYPYPFVDVSKLGLHKVLLNSLGMLGLFLFLSFLFIGAGRLQQSKKQLA